MSNNDQDTPTPTARPRRRIAWIEPGWWHGGFMLFAYGAVVGVAFTLYIAPVIAGR